MNSHFTNRILSEISASDKVWESTIKSSLMKTFKDDGLDHLDIDIKVTPGNQGRIINTTTVRVKTETGLDIGYLQFWIRFENNKYEIERVRASYAFANSEFTKALERDLLDNIDKLHKKNG